MWIKIKDTFIPDIWSLKKHRIHDFFFKLLDTKNMIYTEETPTNTHTQKIKTNKVSNIRKAYKN
jgi:hypothetical protein